MLVQLPFPASYAALYDACVYSFETPSPDDLPHPVVVYAHRYSRKQIDNLSIAETRTMIVLCAASSPNQILMKTLYILLSLIIVVTISCTDRSALQEANSNVSDSLVQVVSNPNPPVEEAKPEVDGVYYMLIKNYGAEGHNFLILEGGQIVIRSYTMGFAVEYSTEIVADSEKKFKVCSPYNKRGCDDFYVKPNKLISTSGESYEKIADAYTWEELEKRYNIRPSELTKLNN